MPLFHYSFSFYWAGGYNDMHLQIFIYCIYRWIDKISNLCDHFSYFLRVCAELIFDEGPHCVHLHTCFAGSCRMNIKRLCGLQALSTIFQQFTESERNGLSSPEVCTRALSVNMCKALQTKACRLGGKSR